MFKLIGRRGAALHLLPAWQLFGRWRSSVERVRCLNLVGADVASCGPLPEQRP